MAAKGFSKFPPFTGDAICVVARASVAEIANICRLFDLYEGVAYVRTRDPERGIMEFWVSPSFMEYFRLIFEAVGREAPMEIIAEDK